MTTATVERPTTDTALREWAEQVAASLPPFTADEARAAGRLAAALDAQGEAR
jgi:hypothetical protein